MTAFVYKCLDCDAELISRLDRDGATCGQCKGALIPIRKAAEGGTIKKALSGMVGLKDSPETIVPLPLSFLPANKSNPDTIGKIDYLDRLIKWYEVTPNTLGRQYIESRIEIVCNGIERDLKIGEAERQDDNVFNDMLREGE